MNKKQFEYTTIYGGTEYTVIISESGTAKETVNNKLKKLLVQDLSGKVRLEGENL